MENQNKINNIYQYLKDKKCKDIAIYENKSNIQTSSFIIIVSNANSQINKKFAQSLMEDMKIDEYPEGYSKGEWIILDFGDVILHSFIPAMREKYSLDKLYHNKRLNMTKQNKK